MRGTANLGAASVALAAGVDFKVVSELLGHTGAAITRGSYTSVFTPPERQAVDAVAAALAAARTELDEQPDLDEEKAALTHRRDP